LRQGRLVSATEKQRFPARKNNSSSVLFIWVILRKFTLIERTCSIHDFYLALLMTSNEARFLRHGQKWLPKWVVVAPRWSSNNLSGLSEPVQEACFASIVASRLRHRLLNYETASDTYQRFADVIDIFPSVYHIPPHHVVAFASTVRCSVTPTQMSTFQHFF
jgi:hypothetical protein